MNDEQNNNEFDELFKENNIQLKPEIPKSNSPYFLSILYYLLIMLVLSTIVAIIFLGMNNTTMEMNPDQQAIESVASNTNGITLINSSVYAMYAKPYDSYVSSIGVYGTYEVVINIYNSYVYTYLVTEDDALISENLEAILTGQRVYWDDASIFNIVLYESSMSLYSTSAIETTLFDESYTTYTDFTNSLVNFITYMALSPVLALVLLRRDITADLLVYKKKWGQFIPPVLIGYALALVGNFAANFLSGLVGQLFGQMQSTSANQMIIERSLQSNGVLLIFVSAVILGPIAEELIFRQSIFKLIKNQTVALVVSAIAFGAIHLASEPTIADAFINGIVYISLGFVFGYIYIRNKQNIAINIAVHIVYNLVSVLAVLILL